MDDNIGIMEYLTKSTHLLSFNKLSPDDFSRLCFWIVEYDPTFSKAELYDGTGDKGRDVIATKIVNKDYLELWYFQCKNYKKASFSHFEKDLIKISLHSKNHNDFKPDVIVFVTGCNVSPYSKDKTKASGKEKGFNNIIFWDHVKLDKCTKSNPKILSEFFNIQSQDFRYLPKSFHKDIDHYSIQQFSNTLFHKCPSLPEDYISRTKWMDTLNNAFKEKPFAYLYGYPKVSKTSIAAEFVTAQSNIQYYWYNFKGNNSYDSYINNFTTFLKNIGNSTQDPKKKHKHDYNLSQLIREALHNCSELLLVLDDVHLVSSKHALNDLLYLIIQTFPQRLRVLLISETKAGFEDSDWWLISNSFVINGFNADEIKLLYCKESLDLKGFTKSTYELIQYHTKGHPLLVKSYLEELKSSGISPLDFVLDSTIHPVDWLGQENKFREHIQSKVYNTLLSDETEKLLFNRLSALIYPFTYDQAEVLSYIEPKIEHPKYVFNSLKSKILEPLSESDYEVPLLFKNIGKYSLSKDEESDIYKSIGHHLSSITDNQIEYLSALRGYQYLLFAEEYSKALKGISFLISLSIYHNEHDALRTTLEDCGHLTIHEKNIKTEEILNFYTSIAFGFLVIKEFSSAKRIIDKIRSIKDIDKERNTNEVFQAVLFQYFGFVVFNKDYFLEAFEKILLSASNSKLPISTDSTNNLINTAIVLSCTKASSGGIFIIADIFKIAEKYQDVAFPSALDFAELPYDFFYMLVHELFSGFQKRTLNPETDLNIVITSLNDIRNIFKNVDYHLGYLLITKLMGSLLVSFGTNHKQARTLLKTAHKLLYYYPDITIETAEIEAEILTDLADSHFESTNYACAVEYYDKAISTKRHNQKWNFLLFHSLRRGGISKYHQGSNDDALLSFFEGLRHTYKHENKYNEYGFQILGEIVVFYINQDNMDKAIQTLCVMVRYIPKISNDKSMILFGHTLGWIGQYISKDEGEPITLDNGEEFTKPYFEFFTKNISLEEFQGTITALYSMIGTALYKLGYKNKASHWFKKVVNSETSTYIDKSAFFVSLFTLSDIYINCGQLLKAIKLGIKQLIKAKRGHPIATPDGEELNMFTTVQDQILLPICNSMLKNHKDTDKKSESEQFLLDFVKLADNSEALEHEKVLSLAKTSLGIFYYIHQEEEKGNKWLTEGYALAKKNDYSQVTVQADIWKNFLFTKEIYNLAAYFVENCKTMLSIIQLEGNSDNFKNSFVKQFCRAWNDLAIPEDYLPNHENQSQIIYDAVHSQDLNESMVFHRLCEICIIGLSLINEKELVISISEYLIKKIDFCTKASAIEILSKYCESKKKIAVSMMNTNIEDLIKVCEESICFIKQYIIESDNKNNDLLTFAKAMIRELTIMSGGLTEE